MFATQGFTFYNLASMSLDLFADASGRQRSLLCIEVNPPKGADLDPIYRRLDGANLAGIDFFNVTDSALAKMRFAPLPFASLLKQRYSIEPLVNISCRDRNLIALQSDLLAGWAMGVRSVVALTGDAMTIGDLPEGKGVFEVNSLGLLQALRTLNAGKDLAGHALHGNTGYVPGSVVNPNAKNVAAEIKRLTRKREAGARYALSQPVYDIEAALHFFRAAEPVGVPILVGLLPFKSSKSLVGIGQIPGIRFPEHFSALVASKGEDDLSEFSLAHSFDLAKGLRPHVAGYHVISGATPKLALELTQRIAQGIREGSL